MTANKKTAGIKLPVYMDYQATTPLDPVVLEAMMPCLTNRFGNPHSVNHRYGWEAEAVVEKAREQVAGVIGAPSESVVFTSGATESNNMAIKGVLGASAPHRHHIVTVVTEHKCVLESCRAMERAGARVTFLSVDADGMIDTGQLEQAIGDDTALVSVMAVNNEIGVIQPLREIGRICRAKGVLFHTDAAQAVGKIPLDVEDMNIDLMSISAHKMYGPKGVGALYVRRRPRVRMAPLMDGGGQEGGYRSGTLSPALCVGMGEASSIAVQRRQEELDRIGHLSNRFIQIIESRLDTVVLNGHRLKRFPGNINFSFGNVSGDLLIAELRNLAVSSGAACASASKEASYVLKAIGVDASMARSSIRFGIGRFTTMEEIEFAAEEVIAKVEKLRCQK